MRILVVKTSSLGDVIHTLPAISDLQQTHPKIKIDWLVEEAFAEIPSWHPAVKRVIPVALRRWRKQPLQAIRSGEWRQFKQQLRLYAYDKIIDAQGLLKSAWLASLARGQCWGLDANSAREPLSRLFYQHQIAVAKQQHAVMRTRQLFSQVFAYDLENKPLDYGLNRDKKPNNKTLLFFHATTWASKHWPESYWIDLADIAVQTGYQVLLPWHGEIEYQRVLRIQQQVAAVEILPKMNLSEIKQTLSQVQAVVGVDTGLSHLAAALAIPSISIYGSTRPAFTGTFGHQQVHLQAQRSCAPCLLRQCPYNADFPPCYETISPAMVWENLQTLIQPLLKIYDNQ